MSLRVLHVLDHSIPLHSGYAFRTLSILHEQRKLGWETFQLTSPKQVGCRVDEEEVGGVHFFRTPSEQQSIQTPVFNEFQQMRRVERRLEELVRRFRPDILHAHSPVLNAIPALRVGRRSKTPVVYEVRAFWEDAAVDHGTTKENSLRYRVARGVETYALRRSHHVTTICEGLKRDIVARGIAEGDVTVIPNAVDVDAFKFDATPDEELKNELGLGGKTVIGFLGSYYAYEGLDLLVAALPRVLEGMSGVNLLLAGGGPEETSLKAQVQRLGLGHKVRFIGRVPHEEVQRYYSIVDLLVYPRRSMRLTELVTPLKPLEAMAQGRILTASDVGGHRELVRHGETGFLFPAGDPEALAKTVLRVLGDRSQWTRIRESARDFVVAQRNWKSSVARYCDVFHRLAGKS